MDNKIVPKESGLPYDKNNDYLGIFGEDNFSDIDFGFVYVTDDEKNYTISTPDNILKSKNCYRNMILHLYHRTEIFRNIMVQKFGNCKDLISKMLKTFKITEGMDSVKDLKLLYQRDIYLYKYDAVYEITDDDKSCMPIQINSFLRTTKYGFDLIRIKMKFNNYPRKL